VIPKCGNRYFSLALMDMYTNNFAILGTRTTGGDGGTFTLVGPITECADPMAIRSPTRWVWALARVLVDDEADLIAANQIQDQLRIEGPNAGSDVAEYSDRNASWENYFGSLQALLNENPPPITDTVVLRRIDALVRLGGTFESKRFSDDESRAIRAGVAEAHSAVRNFRLGLPRTNGWSTSAVDLGAFGQNYNQRAATALGGLAALPRYEAMYFTARGPNGTGYDSSRNWRLTFGKGELPPVESFWSLSLYRVTEDGQSYFAENPINRYAIGDRTPNLWRDQDGSLTIWMSRTDPDGHASHNWLPTPSNANFVLALRAYIPRREMLLGKYQVPGLVAT
jgi:hypothetical protein